jgi:surface antigen
MKIVGVALMTGALLIAGCSNKADTGTAIGAVAGGLLGSAVGKGNGRIATAAVGAFVGGIVGHSIGQSMDEVDRRLARDAELEALERGRTGQPVQWRNPDSGRYGEVTPRRTFRRGRQDCREYERRVFIDGEPEVLTGTACRNPDGTWTSIA